MVRDYLNQYTRLVLPELDHVSMPKPVSVVNEEFEYFVKTLDSLVLSVDLHDGTLDGVQTLEMVATDSKPPAPVDTRKFVPRKQQKKSEKPKRVIREAPVVETVNKLNVGRLITNLPPLPSKYAMPNSVVISSGSLIVTDTFPYKCKNYDRCEWEGNKKSNWKSHEEKCMGNLSLLSKRNPPSTYTRFYRCKLFKTCTYQSTTAQCVRDHESKCKGLYTNTGMSSDYQRPIHQCVNYETCNFKSLESAVVTLHEKSCNGMPDQVHPMHGKHAKAKKRKEEKDTFEMVDEEAFGMELEQGD